MARAMTTDRGWIGLFAALALFHSLYRAAMGGALGLDEAQMILEGRIWAWGYGPQPPLYAWLQHLVFDLLGESIFALALLKNLLLWLTYGLLYAGLRGAGMAPGGAGPVALSLFFLPQIAWESQRALTHSVLVSCLAMATMVAALRIVAAGREPGGTRWFIALGIAMGLGGIAKYNYLLVPLALLLAAGLDPETRRALWRPRLGLSLAIAGLIVARPWSWALAHRDASLASADKFALGNADGPLAVAGAGLASFAGAGLGFLGLLALVAAALYLRGRDQSLTPPPRPALRLMGRTALVGAGLVLGLVLLAGATEVRDRWLQPVLIFAAPALLGWLWPRLGQRARRAVLWLEGAVAAGVILALPVHNLHGDAYRAAPFADLARTLEAEAPTPPAILAETPWLAGNLAFQRPDWPVADGRRLGFAPAADRTILIVWQSETRGPARRLARLIGPGRLRRIDLPPLAYRFAPDTPFDIRAARLERPTPQSVSR